MTDIRLIDMRHEVIDGGVGRYSRTDNGYVTIGRAYHHTAVLWLRPDATEVEERNHVHVIDQYHHGKGWGGFGYNGIVFPSGRAYFCGDWDGARAHVSSRNHELDGICFAGIFVGREPTDAAIAGARLLRGLSVEAHGEIPEAGHGAWALPQFPTGCPGDDYGENWIPRIAEEENVAVTRVYQPEGKPEVYREDGAHIPDFDTYEALRQVAEESGGRWEHVMLPVGHRLWRQFDLPPSYLA